MNRNEVSYDAKCVRCKGVVSLVVHSTSLAEWQRGTRRPLRYLFPDLTPAEREMFLSSICGTCWNKIFDDDGGEEDVRL